MTILSNKIVKLKKSCECFGCSRKFVAGEKIKKVVRVNEDGFNITAWCDVCIEYWNKYMSDDDEISRLGNIH